MTPTVESVLRSLHDPAAPGHVDPCPTCEDIVVMGLTIEADARADARKDAERLAEALATIAWMTGDCPAAMEPESFYRSQFYAAIGTAARALNAHKGGAS